MKKQARVLASVFALAYTACGDSSGGGVSSAKQLGDLDAAERTALCDEYGSVLDTNTAALAEVSCTLSAIAAGAQCEAERKACLDQASADAGPGAIDVAQAKEGCESGVGTSCPTITVGEARACFDALEASVKAVAASVSCSSTEVPEAPSTPAACKSLGDRCPELASIGGS